MSQSQVDEKTGKVVCRQYTDGDLTKEMKRNKGNERRCVHNDE